MAMTDEEAVRHAAQAIQAGDRQGGKELLRALVQANPRNAQAWLLLSSVVDSEQEQRECLLRTLAIEPENSVAQAELDWLNIQLEDGPSPPPAEQAADGPLRERLRQPASPTASVIGPSAVSSASLSEIDMPSRPPWQRPGGPSERHALEESARTRGIRNIMLAGAMVLTLICGLTLLVLTIVRVVPQMQERMRPTPEAVLYTATLWCPACVSTKGTIILWEQIGDGTSRGAKVGELLHNTPVSVLAEGWSEAEQRIYLKVAAQGLEGWVSDSFVRRSMQSPQEPE